LLLLRHVARRHHPQLQPRSRREIDAAGAPAIRRSGPTLADRRAADDKAIGYELHGSLDNRHMPQRGSKKPSLLKGPPTDECRSRTRKFFEVMRQVGVRFLIASDRGESRAIKKGWCEGGVKKQRRERKRELRSRRRQRWMVTSAAACPGTGAP